MGRVGALVCVLMLCITLPTVAFAEEPFGNVIQQTQMEEVIESEQPVTDTADSEQEPVETVPPEQPATDTADSEQEPVETVPPEQPATDTADSEQEPVETVPPEQPAIDPVRPEQETLDTIPPEQPAADAVENGQTADETQAPDVSEPGIALDAENFPDAAFLESLRKFDLDADGALSQSECEAVTKIDVRNRGIRSLQGIGVFPNLTELNCIGNALSELPLDQTPNLTSLLCNENELTQLDLSLVPMLQVLHCHDNQLAELDVSQAPQLYEIACGDNAFTSLDVSHNTQLVYLLYLGGPLKTLTLGENDALRELWCSYTLVSQLDLAKAPNLEMLGVEYSEIQFLNLETNQHLTHVLAAGCRLLGAKLPAGVSADFSAQRAVEVQIGEQETTYDLMRLVLPLDAASISDVTGAELQGSVLSGISDNTTVTYRYQTDAAPLTASIVFRVSNAWAEPLSLEDWTYGQPPHSPHAQAEYGNVVYTYSDSPDGTFGPEVPSQAGTWYVKASVAASPEHAGLTDIEEFHILKAHQTVAIPSGLTAVYTSTLASVNPGSGFVWEDPQQNVGSVGVKTFLAKYVPADLNNYEIEYHLPIAVNIVPKQAQEDWVPKLTGPQDVASLQIRDGQTVLRQRQDYEVTTYTEDGRVTVSILFRGNYTGQIQREYVQASSVPVPPNIVVNEVVNQVVHETKVPPSHHWNKTDTGEKNTRPEETPSATVPSESDKQDGALDEEKNAEPGGQESETDENAAAPSKQSSVLCRVIWVWILLVFLLLALWLFERYKNRKDKAEKSDGEMND